jgi:hypothetical protein
MMIRALSYSSSSTTSTCQAYADAVTWNSTVTVLSATYTIGIYLVHAWRLKDRWENSPGVAARFWFVAVVPKLCAAIALITFLVPDCPATCPCDPAAADTMYAYPSISLLLCAVWVARGLALLRRARQLGNAEGLRPSPVALDDKDYDHSILPAHAALKASATTPVADEKAGNRPLPSETEMV